MHIKPLALGQAEKEGKLIKIAILGAGAMGALFGSYLSRQNQVCLIDVNEELVRTIRRDGVEVTEPDGAVQMYHPDAALKAPESWQPADLVIVFVKAMYSKSALEHNRGLIGPDTCLMTLQNGGGHEQTLLQFADEAHVIIGSTQHNSAVRALGAVRHGGSGNTCIGLLEGDSARLQPLADNFTRCGLVTFCSQNVREQIWEKLFTNVSASVLTGALQMPLGYIAQDPDAWAMCETLIREAVAVANADGLAFDAEEKISEVRRVCENSPQGLTSIYADLRDHRRSEVDSISGNVVAVSRRCGVPVPSHEFIVHMIHALEHRSNSAVPLCPAAMQGAVLPKNRASDKQSI